MNIVINIAAIGLSLLLLSVPIVNRYVFHTVNIDEIFVVGRDGLAAVQDLQREQKFEESRDSAQSLIERFSNDSVAIFGADISDWPRVRRLITGDLEVPHGELITDDLDDEEISGLAADKEGKGVPFALRRRVVGILNRLVGDPKLLSSLGATVSIEREAELRSRLRDLASAGVLTSQGAPAKEKLSQEEKERLERFNVLLIEKAIYPSFVRKNLARGKDWASEYIVQTSLYFIGVSYKAEFQLDRAMDTWNDLIRRYPKSIYAEVLFLQIGQALYTEGRKLQVDGQVEAAQKEFVEAIGYLEKIEQNREIAREFPKYKYADLTPGTYVNVDASSRAKERVREKTRIYTTDKAEEDLAGKADDDRSGYFLEDAIKLIGECYTQLGRTDSARSQFGLLLDFFPESDNLDDAQKLIADSYAKDGDMAQSAADSTRNYELAVKEYLKFVNVYPQSDLISETYIALGDAYNKLGRSKEANGAFAAALGRAKEAEEQAKVQLKIGNYYYERKRYAEAIDAYQVILNNFLSTEVASNAQYMLGECYEATGDTVKAIENYEVILEHYKQSSFMGGAAYKIGSWCFEKGN
jgi:tetratricopeptide (TPR) repeat protein